MFPAPQGEVSIAKVLVSFQTFGVADALLTQRGEQEKCIQKEVVVLSSQNLSVHAVLSSRQEGEDVRGRHSLPVCITSMA